MKEHEARKYDFKRSDLAFYIERLQILLEFINTDLAGNLTGYAEAVERTQDVWDTCRGEHYTAARVPLAWFYGYAWTIPESHRSSYRHVIKEIVDALY